jgi:hypothetical protein
MASAKGQDLFHTSSIETRRQEQRAAALVSTLQGQNTNIVAANNLVSIGANLGATGVDNGTGILRVEGKNTTALYEVQDFNQVSTTTRTKTTENSFFDPLGIGLSEPGIEPAPTWQVLHFTRPVPQTTPG